MSATPSPADLVRRFLGLCKDAALHSEIPAASPDAPVSGSKPTSRHLSLGPDRPLRDRILSSFANWLAVWEREVEGKRPPRIPDQDKVSARRKAQTKAILAEVGLDPTAVAFAHGSTTEKVERLRGRSGRDPETGERVGSAGRGRIDGKQVRLPRLTASGQAALTRLEERHADGEVGFVEGES